MKKKITQAQAFKNATSTHTWPLVTDKFEEPTRQAKAQAFFDSFLTSRAHSAWSPADIVLLADLSKINTIYNETLKDIEIHGPYEVGPTGRRVRSASVDVLSILQSSRQQLLGKLKIASVIDDTRVTQNQGRKETAIKSELAKTGEDDLLATASIN